MDDLHAPRTRVWEFDVVEKENAMSIKINRGQIDEYRDGLHAFGTANPFTLATITLAVGFILGALIF